MLRQEVSHDEPQASQRPDLRLLFDSLPVSFIAILPDLPNFTIVAASDTYLRHVNRLREEIVGQSIFSAFSATDPNRWATLRQMRSSFERVLATRQPDTMPTQQYGLYPTRPPGGGFEEQSWLSVNSPVFDSEGEIRFIVHRVEDITEHKTTEPGRDRNALQILEQRNAFLLRMDDAIRSLTDATEITKTISKLLVQHLQVSRSGYAEIEEDEDHFRGTSDHDRGGDGALARYALSQFGEQFRDHVRAGQVFVLNDSEMDPRVAPVAHIYRQHELRALISAPLHKEGRLIATLAVYQSKPRVWRQDEVELVQMVVSRCWESIQRARLTRQLAARESRFQFLAESIPQLLWTANSDGAVNYLSSQGLRYLGAREEEVYGAAWLTSIHEDDREQTMAGWMRAIELGITYETAYRLRRHDGTWRWQLVRAVPSQDDVDGSTRWYGTCTDIEDQKQAEASLQRQWKTFDTALSNSPDYIYIFDLKGRFSYANKAVLTLFQKSQEEVVGKDFLELDYPAEQAAHLSRQVRQVIETRQSVRDRITFTPAGGEPREYEHIFVPVLDSDNRVTAVTGSSRDVTQQKLAEELIRQDRQRWQELLLRAPAGIAVLRGPQHIFECVNSEYRRLAGRKSDEELLLGRSVIEALPEIAAQGYVDMLDRVYETGQAHVEHEAPLLLREANHSKQAYVSFACLPTRDADGKVDGTFIHASDVTSLVQARLRVEESERQFRTLAETIPHLAWMAHADGHIFWYNRRWYEYTGTSLREMEGWGWQKVHDPACLAQVMEQWGDAIAKGEPMDITFPLKAADGQFRTFLTRVEPVRDNQGQVVRWFGTNTDITDHKRTEELLRRMNRDLEEFSYVASHDLQEPLRMVNIYAQLLLRTLGPLDGNAAQYANFVRQGVERMELLVRDLLTFSRNVHTDESPGDTANLSEALNDALSRLKSRIEETGAAISAPPGFPTVCGDTAQMSHVFQNLISNALKYSKKDTVPRIQISVTQDIAHCVVSVQDNGIGFEQQHAERIFGLFKRLHKDNYPGTGLGLAICKRIVERYGGSIWAESIPNAGSTFRFTLPRGKSTV